jgi:hypothetical protein
MALKADIREALHIAVDENGYNLFSWSPQEIADDLREYAEIDGLADVSDAELCKIITERLENGDLKT